MGRRRVSRSIIRFLDSRWGFMHRLQAGAFAVFVAGIIVGISALATQASERVAHSTLASSTHAATNSATATAQSELAQLPATAESTLSEIEVPNSNQALAASATTTPPVPCDESKRAAAESTKSHKTDKEASRHRRVLRTLQNTGLVTRFLNPNMYGYRMSREADRHQKIVSSIQSQYKSSLDKAHCKS